MSKLYLDDIRKAPDDSWTVVRNFQEFSDWLIVNGLPDVVSFDHDLAQEHYASSSYFPASSSEMTGYDCAKWMLERFGMPNDVRVHSMNPVGAERIKNLFEDWRRL